MMTFFADDINRNLEEAIKRILGLEEGQNLVMSDYLDNRVRRAALEQSKPIEMSFSYRFALHPSAPEFSEASRYKPKYKPKEDLSEPTFYEQAGVHIASLVTLRGGHRLEPDCKGKGHRLYLLEDGNLAVFSYEEEHSKEELVRSQEGLDTPYATASYTARLEKLVPKQNLITATDVWLNTTYSDDPSNPYFALSGEDPSRCIYWFKHEVEQEDGPEQARKFFVFDKEFLVGGMDAALDSEDDKATVFFNGGYGRGVCIRDGPTPTPEREARIYLEVNLKLGLGQPLRQRYVAGEATTDYLIARLKGCSRVKVLEPAGQ